MYEIKLFGMTKKGINLCRFKYMFYCFSVQETKGNSAHGKRNPGGV